MSLDDEAARAMSTDGWAIFDSGPGAIRRGIDRMIQDAIKPKPAWLRVIDDCHGGDPFMTLVEFDRQRYVINEAALIEQEERMYREFEAGLVAR